MFKKILVPVDGSELAKKALDYAEMLAKTFDAEIILFQVVHPLFTYRSPEAVAPFLMMDFNQKELAEKYLASLAEELRKRDSKVTTKLKIGYQVAMEIIKFTKESGVDLTVLSTHGRSGISRWVLGSVAHKVLFGAETPILLIYMKK